MDIIKIADNLYLFSSFEGSINLSFNQFLLLGSDSVLIHTGNQQQATELAPKLPQILGERNLSYIFISHFESDECGGLKTIIESFPKAKPVCSAVTARQLKGFGLASEVIVKAPAENLETADYKLSFIGYPSEMHLWEGLMTLETKNALLFSSDIFIRRGKVTEPVINVNWPEEVQGITPEQIPSAPGLAMLQKTLTDLPVKLVAPGHGPCLRT
ncbi:MAG: MBL fold metallo-hydrolase [Bacillota bacterium]